MQLATDTALAQAVDSTNRVVVHKFEVDWGLTGTYDHALSDLTSVVENINLTRDATGALPIETTLIEGFVGAQLQITLGGRRPGDTDPINRLFSPLNDTSPLYGVGRQGTPARWTIGLQTSAGTVPMIRQFTGYIESCRVTDSVALVCTDTNRLHAVINLPLYTSPTWKTGGNTRFRINSHWVIDYVLRQNGIYQSPPPQTGCMLSCTGHGSMVPDVGFYAQFAMGSGTFTDYDQSYVPGRWGIAYNGTATFLGAWYARPVGLFGPKANTSWTFQGQILWEGVSQQRRPEGNPGGFPFITACSGVSMFEPGSTTVALRIDPAGTVWADFYNGATLMVSRQGPSLPVGSNSGWKDIWLRWTIGATLGNCTLEWPGQTDSGVNLSTLPAAPITGPDRSIVMVAAPYPVQAIQMCNATGGLSTLYSPTFVSQCDLDPGLNEMASIPVTRGKESLDVLRDVVGAEYGVAGFDESGRFYFKNRNSVRAGILTAEKVVSPEPALKDLATREPPGSVRNIITARVVSLAGKFGTVWSITDPSSLVIQPGFWEFRLLLDRPGARTSTNLTFATTAVWDANTNRTGLFVACSPGLVEQPTVTASVIPDFAALAAGVDQFILRVNNPTNSSITFQTATGSPALEVGGIYYINESETTLSYTNSESIARYGSQTFPLDTNEWRQLVAFVEPIAMGLLKDLKYPTPLLDRMSMVGDPRLQLLDSLELSDRKGLGGPVLVAVELIERQLTGRKLEDSLAVRIAHRPNRWILGHPTQSVLGVTTIPG